MAGQTKPTDTLSPSQRSERMSRIRSKDTRPELAVRQMVHSMGFRYRLHQSHLPGSPDLVFPARKKIIFIHGCFWHRHAQRCPLTRLPKSHLDFWRPKLEKNRIRDDQNRRRLRAAGWHVLTLWECQLRKMDLIRLRVMTFLNSGESAQEKRC